MSAVESNPFATRFIRPGAIEFLFPSGQSLESLIDQLRRQDWMGQIIGPHGSGKSTLVAALCPALEAAGRRILRANDQRLEILSAETQVIVDGFEQLSWWARRKKIQDCRRSHAGLLITAHSDMGLPLLVRTEPTLDQAQAVVARLLPGKNTSITPHDVAGAYEAAQGDIREALFKLYDVYQERQASR